MANRPTIITLATGVRYDTTTLNANFQAIMDAFDNLVGRSGTSGDNNSFQGDLDLAGHTIRNYSLSANALGVNWRGSWATDTVYEVNDLVNFNSTSAYICKIEHTSGTFATDLADGDWELFAAQGAAGNGSGDMISTNNLSDVANVSTARDNLGLTIGTNVQAYSAKLADISGFTLAKGSIVVTDGTNLKLLAVGTNNQVLVADSTQANGMKWAANAATNASPTVHVFTSNATWTKPTNCRRIKVTVVGPGGKGGDEVSAETTDNGGGGAGSGGVAIKWIDVSAVNSVSVTVGATGTSSFGSYCSATQGGNGSNGSDGVGGAVGAAGTASGGDINLAGKPGVSSGTTSNGGSMGGEGADAPLGFGFGGSASASGIGSIVGNPGINYGSGGGGAGGNNVNGGSTSGGNGGSGIIIVEEYY